MSVALEEADPSCSVSINLSMELPSVLFLLLVCAAPCIVLSACREVAFFYVYNYIYLKYKILQ